MKLKDVVEKLGLEVLHDAGKLDAEVTAGYSGDLLSDVMANATEGGLWVTIQLHTNVAAVALFKNLTGIVFAEGRKPQQETLEKAAAEGIALLSSPLSAYEISGKMYGLGVPGRGETAGR